MKKLLVLLVSLFRSKRQQADAADDLIWEHLDGAEFTVIPPAMRPTVTTD